MTKHLLEDPDYARLIVGEVKSTRSPFEQDWRDAALRVLPRQHQSWQNSTGPAGNTGFGQSTTRKQNYDSTGRRMLPRFIAVIDRMLTPRGQRWHTLKTSDESLNKSRRVKEFYQGVSELLFTERYKPAARFTTATSEAYGSIGTFGNTATRIEARKRTPISRPGLLYRTMPWRDVFWRVNGEGDRDTQLIRMWKNARQLEREGFSPLPPVVMAELKKDRGPNEQRYFEIYEICEVNYDNFDPEALDARRFPWNRRHFMPEAKAFIDQRAGLVSCPYVGASYFTEPGDIYATSPAIAAASALGVASSIKRHMLKLAEKRADPPLLTADDGIIVDARPNGVTGGGLDRQGNLLVRELPNSGDLRPVETLLADERSDIEDTFLGRVFNILEETRQMTAREVAERVSKEFTLVAPTMGRMQEQYLGPTVDREIDVLQSDPDLSQRFPEVPPELIEAEGEFDVVYTSPMARAERMEDVQGFMSIVEFALNLSAQTQDPSHIDTFRFDVAIPDIAEISNVPIRWMKDPEEIEAKRQQQQQDQMIDKAVAAAPAVSGVIQAGAGQ